MSERRTAKGQVVTFYSHKGGTGRTMALANVGWILAAAGKRVLMADWDIEAPGLPKFFRPFLSFDANQARGVIDLVRRYIREVDRTASGTISNEIRQLPSPERLREMAQVEDYALAVDGGFTSGGELWLLTAGRQNDDYAPSLGAMDWDSFYEDLGGGLFLDALREHVKRNYDYVLIDSRTGFSDIADICTQHLPDILVDCFTLSDQGIEGAARVARAVTSYVPDNDEERRIKVLPVPMRVDVAAESRKVEAGRALVARSFGSLPLHLDAQSRKRYYSSVEVPYRAAYAFEETLAVFDEPSIRNSVLAAYEYLTGEITDGVVTELPEMDETDRQHRRQQFERGLTSSRSAIWLDYLSTDAVWAEWVQAVLTQAGLMVNDPGPIETRASMAARLDGDVLSIASRSYLSTSGPRWADQIRSARLVLYTSDAHLPESARVTVTVNVNALGESEAMARLLRLTGIDPLPGAHLQGPMRFPGQPPSIINTAMPTVNERFTGRTNDLLKIRESLKQRDQAVVLPAAAAVAVHGMGGVGKTALAIEYVHRYASAYDLVWWISSEQTQFIDVRLGSLGSALGLPEESNAMAAARAALAALQSQTEHRRWLLVFDNAEDVEAVRQFLPRSPMGHILITSRTSEWSRPSSVGSRGRADEPIIPAAVEINVFDRTESIRYMLTHTELTQDEANEVATAFGDLPLAIELAAAWFDSTGLPVDVYLRDIEQGRPDAVTTGVGTSYRRSLDQLQQESPASFRLLQVLSVMGPEVSVNLVYSDQMGRVLATPESRGRSILRARTQQVGSLVQRISRLSLLRLDSPAKQIHVHRLIQSTVRDLMTEEELVTTRHQAHLVLAEYRPDGEPDDPRHWDRYHEIWPHLETSRAPGCHAEQVRQLMIDRVRYLRSRGDLTPGRAFGDRVTRLWANLIATGGGEHAEKEDPEAYLEALKLQLLHLQFNVANILRDQSLYREALELDTRIADEQQDILGADHAYTLMTAGGKAADLRAMGHYQEALALEVETANAWDNEFGPDWHRTLMARNNLATSLRSMGNFAEARTIDEDVLLRRRQTLSPDHPYTLHTMTRLGRDLRELGEYERSVEVLTSASRIAEEKLGPDAAITLVARTTLAASLRASGRPDDAQPILDEAYGRLVDRFGERSPDAMACQSNLAVNAMALGRDRQETLRKMSVVTREYENWLGRDHPLTLVSIINQSAAERSAGFLSTATSLADEAVAQCDARLGPSHPFGFAARMNLSLCLLDADQRDGLLDGMRQVYADMAQRLGTTHPDTLACCANLLLTALKLGDHSGLPAPEGDDAKLQAMIDDLSGRLGRHHSIVRLLQEGEPVHRAIDPPESY